MNNGDKHVWSQNHKRNETSCTKNFMKMILEPANNTNTNPFLSIFCTSDISYLQSIVSPTSRISNQLSDNFNTNLFPFRYLSNILYLQYIASPISSISNISKLQYLISPIYHISNISYLQYLVSPIFCISDILYLQYLVSPISHISNIWNIQVSNL